MTWLDKIKQARRTAEVLTGWSPEDIIIRQEIWEELFDEVSYFEGTEIDGMTVAISATLQNPFKLVIDVDKLQDGAEKW